MKIHTKILFIFLFIGSFFIMNAQNYYDQQWKKIEDNYKKGLYKSNLPIVLEIQNRAKKEANSVQLIKSLKAEFSIVNQTQDDTQNDAASQFFAKLKPLEKELKGDDQLLYRVLLGDFFQEYFDNNVWEIRQRTDVAQTLSDGKDLFDSNFWEGLETWSTLDFKNFLTQHYTELNKQNSKLKNISLSKYKEIFYQTENIDYFPTLFDYKSTTELEFLKSTEFFTPNERKENHPKINSIYDELITKNSGNSKLYFQHQKINYNCEFTNCKDRFEQLEKLVENENTDGDYKVRIIEDIMNLAVGKKDNKLALIWGNDAREMYPKSKFINNITNIENRIKNPNLTLHYEQEIQSNLPIHIVAEAKNVDRFSLKIYKTSDIGGFMKYIADTYNRGNFTEIKKSLVREEEFSLENKNDFKTYTTSLEIQPLPSGIYLAEYIVENSVQENFYFIVSDSRMISWEDNRYIDKDNLYKLVRREDGKPLTQENLEIYEYVRGKTLKNSSAKTTEKGTFLLPKSTEKDNYYYRYYLIKNSENNYQLVSKYGENQSSRNDNQDRNLVQIFLDRGIYRPGQIVYFKVINIQLKNEKESVVAGLQQTIKLYDTNGQEIGSQDFTTNDFGSYHGSFTLPKGKLNGNFSIRVEKEKRYGYKYFKVEEYKRPKFEVTFEPIKDEYKYGQTVEIKGKAMMFSGVPLSDATVNYEIKKQNIRWRYFWWYPQESGNENSILGSVKTNEKGEFTIQLELKKDETLEGIQIDNYEIEAGVTDINGETQSATENVKVASVSHYISADEIGNVFSDEKVELKVETKNYNRQNLSKSYHAKLSKLEEPNRVFRSNFESKIQNLPKLSKAEFIKKFPHDRFDKNDQIENWKVEKVLSDIVTLSGVEASSMLNLGKLEAGTYRLELYNIEGKDTIITQQNFQVWNKKSLQNSQRPFLQVIAPKEEIERGKKAKIYVYSTIPDASLNIFLQNGNGETQTETLKMKNGVLVYEVVAPKDESISQLNLQFQLVAFNDVQTETAVLKLKDEDKNLKIETVSFRDKIEPGQKEKWSVKILEGDASTPLSMTNAKAKSVTLSEVEMLANMYDKSLDQFAGNSYSWGQLFYQPYYVSNYNERNNLRSEYFNKRVEYLNNYAIGIPEFSWFDGRIFFASDVDTDGDGVSDFNDACPTVRGSSRYNGCPKPLAAVAMEVTSSDKAVYRDVSAPVMNAAQGQLKGVNVEFGSGTPGSSKKDSVNQQDIQKVKVRENLNETAFFYPNLYTDKDGNVSFEFTSPEALTKWKLMFLAHTKDARGATLEKEVVTQKEFSVTPNYPRFLREGDELQLQSKLSNLTKQALTGTASLQILDAFTNEDISQKFNLNEIQQNFSVKAEGNSVVNWKLKVPNDVSSIILKIVATSTSLSKAGSFSDGEQKAIAVLPNRMLVTDAIPIFVKEGQTKTFVLENLKNSSSTTATNFSNTLELTTNPIWEIMFALPSLKDDQNNSADVVFNKWFADVLASEIFKANPKMKTVFDEYQSKGLLKSNLEKNQELKQLLLEETPWVLQSKNEEEQMQKLARIFDANSMRNSINDDWSELIKLQNPDGGFSWVQGYPSSYYTSLYILKNLGRINVWLKGNLTDYQSTEQKEMVKKLVNYVDQEVDRSTLFNVTKENIWTNFVLDYLDTRHYWESEFPLKNKGKTLKNLVVEKAPKADIKDFTFFGLHRAALLFDDYKLTNLSNKLMTYLKETSTETETQGVYWKQNLNDWGWYSSKTINHAGALEAFQKLKSNDLNFIEEMKIWLVTQKEVNSWGSSRGTAEVIFTILNSGKSWTSNESDKAEISWGIASSQPSPKEKEQNATGYYKKSVQSDKIDKNLATVTIKKGSPGIVQGGLFWQYYEDLDQIKSSESYISITKELYKKVKTENGEQLVRITENSPLKIGDKVTVRMILNTDRNMEFIHLKDMRAAGFEPLNIISKYRWNNGLGYYESTKDASTNFYIQNMPKGKYVFEYDYVCNAAGTFSNGITTLQNYYAPQMNAHTKGDRVRINE